MSRVPSRQQRRRRRETETKPPSREGARAACVGVAPRQVIDPRGNSPRCLSLSGVFFLASASARFLSFSSRGANPRRALGRGPRAAGSHDGRLAHVTSGRVPRPPCLADVPQDPSILSRPARALRLLRKTSVCTFPHPSWTSFIPPVPCVSRKTRGKSEPASHCGVFLSFGFAF